ncbi:alpha/beta hydrolase family domain-containing protein [Purpureocillium lilacinum]|uniref:Alpha/beta hydrolase family domain-containing protein n=1 Tax=Purpureocillium lilacinum TaxID=33203 RepID=A0A179HSE1_PURLI|nr:alpha/beta hydrolase family domain-containing protein [Purpureocillium lilacinum]OAQ92488.1 alpha/beta hydrolase family domain-containing protein [Purpureocillium lilacinum]GJN84267.1 hypothetical protein PLIIFM63780_007823 [Purpureocillium lilacinum]
MALPLKYSSPNGTVRWTRLGSGPPLVFNHGTPWSSFVWRDIADAFTSTHTVYLWDMPGYGLSDKYDGQDVSLGAQGKLFAELLAHWFPQQQQRPPPIVFAHDFGGAVALRAHLLHGARYAALALVDPVALAPWGSPFFRLVGANADVFAQLPANLHGALVREYISGASHAGLRAETLEELARPWCDGEGQAAFYRQIAQASERFTDEVEGRYGEVPAGMAGDGDDVQGEKGAGKEGNISRVLLVWGTEDTWVPVERGRELQRRMGGGGVVLREIAGAGHLVQMDRPAQLTGVLMEFVGGVGGARVG